MIVVFSKHSTSRLQYVLSELLERRMGIPYTIVTQLTDFQSDTARVKINYTAEPVAGSVHIKPHGLLSETGIRDLSVEVNRHDEWNMVFWTNTSEEVPFDVFAATFYLLSRYEEYVNPIRDEHGRFEAKHSLAFQHHFLRVPVIEVWAAQLKKIFLGIDPGLIFTKHTYTRLSTIDVDFAFKYKGVGIKRWTGKLFRSLLSLKLADAADQLLVSTGLKRDPYDTFDQIHKTTNSGLAYFMLMNASGGHDKATNFKCLTSIAGMLKEHANFIGIHPSYQSNTEHQVLNEEISALKSLTGSPVKHSRNHFLKLALPQTYQRVIAAGIECDYTMMYADAPGFRAGTCFPFFFYDLSREQTTALTVYSTCAMDVTLKDYIRVSPNEAIRILNDMETIARKYQGLFITLWHNSSFIQQEGWREWNRVYTSIFNTKQ
ncbi:MAG: polysaccharide deacetylase family protein [Bacteroidota bacterium]